MPFALVFIGMILVVTGFQNTYAQLGSQVGKDFSGPGNFFYWIIALGIVGVLGYNDTLKPFSRATMGLIIIAMFVKKDTGFFAKFNEAISSGTSTKPLPAGGIAAGESGGGGGALSNGIGLLEKGGGLVDTLGSIGSIFGF